MERSRLQGFVSTSTLAILELFAPDRSQAKESILRQLFSAFPGGRSGIALALLRFALGLIGVAEGVNCFAQRTNAESLFLGILLAAGGISVAFGIFTSYAAAAIAAAIIFRMLASSSVPPSVSLQGPFSTGILIVQGVAVALLGPGVFSLDFRFFGRREIVIPRRTPE